MPVKGEFGSFFYAAASLAPAGELRVKGQVMNLRVFAVGGDASFSINGGDAIAVRTTTGFDWSPDTTVKDVTFTCVSGNVDIFVELARLP